MAVFISGGGSGGGSTATTTSSAFLSTSWADIITACQTNNVPSTWNVGDYKNMTIGGVEYRIDIIGKNHDVYSDGTGTAPLTFQLHDCYGTDYAMNTASSNSGGWEESEMRTTRLPAIFKTMPSEVQLGIREVNKLTGVGSVIETTADKLFLLSQVEVLNSVPFSLTGEGVCYEYYINGQNTVKGWSNAPKPWYNRSQQNGNTRAFCAISPEGVATTLDANYVRGLSFAFCF